MTTTKITTDLLEALLAADTQRRREAEAYFQAVPVPERVAGHIDRRFGRDDSYVA